MEKLKHKLRQVKKWKIRRSQIGTELFGLADSVWPFRSDPFWPGPFVTAVSVWGHFGHDISVHKQLIAFVYLNDYIGRRNVTLAGVIPTLFWGFMIAINLNCNYGSLKYLYLIENVDNDLIYLLMITKMLCSCWLTVWILDHVCIKKKNKTFRWFEYVCIKKWTYKISAT